MRVALLCSIVFGAQGLEAQAFDSLGRPRPLASPPISSLNKKSVRLCHLNCVERGPVVYRIVDAAKELLYLSPADTSYDRWNDVNVAGLEATDIEGIEVLKGSAAKELSGRVDTYGLIIISLNQHGTDAWRKAATARAAKAGTKP